MTDGLDARYSTFATSEDSNMPRLFLRGGMYWGDYTDSNGKRARHSLRTHDKKAAKIILNHLENQHALAAFGVVEEDDLRRGEKKRTPLDSPLIGGKDSNVSAFIKAARLTTCGEFGKDRVVADLACWIQEQRDLGLVADTVNRKLWSVQRFGDWLWRNGYIATNAALRVKPIKATGEKRKIVHRAFTPQEAEVLCAGKFGLYYRFRLMTGLRGTEAIQVQRGDLDLGDSPTLHVRDEISKNNHDCTVPLARSLAERLNGLAVGRLFPDVPRDRAKRNRLLREHLDSLGFDASLNGRSFRMSFVTWLEAAGVELGVRMKLRRDKGSESVKLTNVTYSDPKQIMAILRGGVDSLEVWYAKQLTSGKRAVPCA